MKRMKKLIGILTSVFTVVASIATSEAAAPTSYQVTIPPQTWWPCAWSFQDKTVANAFPNAGDGEKCALWDSVNNGWLITDTVSPLTHAWTSPNTVITNGAGFYYYNPSGSSSLVITVSGTPMTNDVTFNFVAGRSYLLGLGILYDLNIAGGSAYGGGSNGNWMECLSPQSTHPTYTDYHLGYSSNVGDIVWIWNSPLANWWGGKVSDTCPSADFLPFWQQYPDPSDDCAWAEWGDFISPKLLPGYGFWFFPAANVSWTQPITQTVCH
jgi:hypothetical protein